MIIAKITGGDNDDASDDDNGGSTDYDVGNAYNDRGDSKTMIPTKKTKIFSFPSLEGIKWQSTFHLSDDWTKLSLQIKRKFV